MQAMEYLKLVMVRPHLDAIPQHALPAGYTMRRFGEGDRATWLAIQQASETHITITEKTFDDNFGGDQLALPRRGFFLVAPDGTDVGTITAWYDRKYHGLPWGRIHWVAIVPAHRGKGLAKPMLSVAMNRLRSLGHRRAILGTQTPRLAAIKVYLDFGFTPDMTAPDAARAWRLVQQHLPHPLLVGLSG
ncbi:MAG TPA: GNAT family N-acetyltransferase [Phycisphaerae bacterium]|nr:GNAT family N-acetyltransferase [Phycisphaerae bacterium]